MKDYIDLISQVPPEILQNVASSAQSFLTPSPTPAVSVTNNPVVQNIFGTIESLNTTKNVVTGILILWAILLLIFQFIPQTNQEQKQDMKYVHHVLFGNMGIIPMIFVLWVIIIIITVVVPSLINITPKFSDLLTNVNGAISKLIMG